MKIHHILYPAVGLLLAAPGIADAHTPGPEAGIVAGLLHPLTGPDHLLTLLAAGFWAQRLGKAARWSIPVTLLIALLAGALLAMSGVQWALIEPAMWCSVAVMTWVSLRGTALGMVPSCSLAAAVGILHGYAHAAGLPVERDLLSFTAGILMTSAALVLVGMALARAAQTASPQFDRIKV